GSGNASPRAGRVQSRQPRGSAGATGKGLPRRKIGLPSFSSKLAAFNPLEQPTGLVVKHDAFHHRADRRLGVKVGEAHAGVVADAAALDDREAIRGEVGNNFFVVRHDEAQVLESFTPPVEKLFVNAAAGDVFDQLNL